MADKEYTYYAYLSYSRQDNSEPPADSPAAPRRHWGHWLDEALKTFDIPPEFVGQINGRGEIIPERIAPVFQDETELPEDGALSAEHCQALEQSVCLIVICSPHSAQSRQVNEVVRYFKQLGRGNRILPIVVAGEPNTGSGKKSGASLTDECFVPALRHPVHTDGTVDTARRAGKHIFVDARHGVEKREILAKDDRRAKADLEMAKIQLLALLIGVGFPGLWRREQERHFFDLAEAQDRARQALRQVEEVRRQLQAAQRQVQEAQKQSLELQNLPRDVQSQIQETQNQALTAQNEAREARQQLQEFQNKVRETQALLEEARGRARAAEGKVLETQQLARETQDQLEATRVQAREAQNQALELQKCAATVQIPDAHDQIRKAKGAAQHAQSQLEEARQQAQEAQNKLLAAQSMVQELQNQARVAQSQLDEARRQVSEAHNQSLAAQDQAREAQNQLEATHTQAREAQNEALEVQNRAHECQVLEAQHQILKAKGDAQIAQSQLNETRQQAHEAQNRLLAAQSTVQELQNQAEAAQTQLEEARRQVRAAQDQSVAAQAQAREAQNQVQETQNQTRDAQSQIEAAQIRVRKFQGQVRNARRLTKVLAVLAVLALMAAGVAASNAWRQRQMDRQALATAAAEASGRFELAPRGEESIRQALQKIGGAEQAENRRRSLNRLAAGVPQAEIAGDLKAAAVIADDQQRSHFQKWLLIRLGWVNPASAMTNASAIAGIIVNDEGLNDSSLYFQLAVLDNWTKTDWSGAFNWVCQLPHADSRQRALDSIIRLVQSQPESDSKNKALVDCIGELAKMDVSGALTLAEFLPEGPGRDTIMVSLWLKADWFAVPEWFNNLAVPPDIMPPRKASWPGTKSFRNEFLRQINFGRDD